MPQHLPNRDRRIGWTEGPVDAEEKFETFENPPGLEEI